MYQELPPIPTNAYKFARIARTTGQRATLFASVLCMALAHEVSNFLLSFFLADWLAAD